LVREPKSVIAVANDFGLSDLQQTPITLELAQRMFYGCRMIRQAVPSDALKAVPLILQGLRHINR